jgi:hypothetical protein
MTTTRRKFAALTCTLVLAIAVCCLSGAGALLAMSQPGIARQLPYGDIAIMRSGRQDAAGGTQGEPARAALRTSALVAPALDVLEREEAAKSRPDEARRARLVVLAGRLGWRDNGVQRKLYDLAIRSGDFAKALLHANAITRVWGPQADLDNSLRVAAGLPAFRAAMLPYFREQAPWSGRWLALSMNALPDEALVDLAKVIPARTDDNAFGTAAQVIGGLVAQGRLGPALEIDSAALGDALTQPGVLEWPDRIRNPQSPFAWKLGEGYAIQFGKSKRLVANGADRMGLTYRLLALQPGDYEMAVGKGQKNAGTWQWAMGCGIKPFAVAWLLEENNAFSVDEDCPVQWIALRGDLASTPLDAMTIRALQEEEEDEVEQ